MATTFKLIGSYTATGTVSTIDFSSIPASYTDLVLKFSTRVSVAGALDLTRIKFNGSATSLSNRNLYANGSGTYSSTATTGESGLSPATSATANTFSNCEIYIPNYAGSTYKSYSADAVSENNATAGYTFMFAGLWSNTAAINQITIVPDTASGFLQYSSAYLYGVKNA